MHHGQEKPPLPGAREAEKQQGEATPLHGRFLGVPQGWIVLVGDPEKHGAPDGVGGGQEAPCR